MGHSARHEIEKHTKNEFAVAQERIALKHARKWRRVLAKVALTHNIGGYAPALTESKAKHVRKQIIALADAYVKTFDLFAVPSDGEAERSFEAEARLIAAGSSSAVLGELDLIQGRIRVSLPKTGSSIYGEIHRSMQSAVNAGKLKLRRQRIKFNDSQNSLRLGPQLAVNRASSTETVAVTKAALGTSSTGSAMGTVADAAEGMWNEYRAWFNAKVESLEAMAARTDPKHLPEDEQDAQKFSTAAMRRRFDEIAEFEYQQWLKSGSPHETFSTRLTELQAQVLEASLKLWSLGSDILRKWYEMDCQPRADSTALRMGDPPAALKIADMVPSKSGIRGEPDFDWMLAAAHFLSHEYAAAERPLLDLFQSPRSSKSQKSAAAYGLCGVYRKTKNTVEQIRFALWLHTNDQYADVPNIADQSIYWASSGWDLNMLLETEVPIDALQAFLDKYPDVRNVRIVKYSLAVRLTRANRYEEAAKIYQSINAVRRWARIEQVGTLYHEASRTDLPPQQLQESKYKLAAFLRDHPDGIYFNDALWGRLQRYALHGDIDSRFTREEYQAQTDAERKLRDDQEERWRAYLILRGVVQDAGKTDLGRKAAQLAIQCIQGISVERFGRQGDMRNADIELSRWLRQP